jgi:hypothetical protein
MCVSLLIVLSARLRHFAHREACTNAEVVDRRRVVLVDAAYDTT